jgi:uncharacterized protein (UPF0548 family)
VRSSRRRRALARLPAKRLNFDVAAAAPFTPEKGWRVDEVRQPLPPEAPGPPEPAGTWEIARRLARDYDFAEPSIVHACFDRQQPLQERNMLLELRFLGLRILAGVRVGDVYDDTRSIEGREARVWGWNYRTLDGHIEEGQMDWQVWKWLDSGEVEFRIHAFSRAARHANPLLRLGFHLVGRREQLRFLELTCRRMARLAAG